MTEFLALALHCVWHFIGAVILVELAAKVCVRVIRMLTVWVRGWPPPHLDADGDWRPETEDPT